MIYLNSQLIHVRRADLEIFCDESIWVEIKDGLSYLFYSFRNKYFNKISLGNMLYFQNKL